MAAAGAAAAEEEDALIPDIFDDARAPTGGAAARDGGTPGNQQQLHLQLTEPQQQVQQEPPSTPRQLQLATEHEPSAQQRPFAPPTGEGLHGAGPAPPMQPPLAASAGGAGGFVFHNPPAAAQYVEPYRHMQPTLYGPHDPLHIQQRTPAYWGEQVHGLPPQGEAAQLTLPLGEPDLAGIMVQRNDCQYHGMRHAIHALHSFCFRCNSHAPRVRVSCTLGILAGRRLVAAAFATPSAAAAPKATTAGAGNPSAP